MPKETKTYSGEYRFRPGPALHEHLAKIAAEKKISLHELTVQLVAGGSNFKLPKKAK
jgi:predicted HicB family RNase H-like nuclease